MTISRTREYSLLHWLSKNIDEDFMMRSTLLAMLILICSTSSALAQKKSKSVVQEGVSLEAATAEVYKTIGNVELKIYRFDPKDHKPSDRRPAIVFFFGGGWKGGDPKQFANHCAALADRGMVAMTADYRVSSRHHTKAIDCVEDAKSAIRWVRANASRLGIDPTRVAAGGGSAGGHLAACTGLVPGYEKSSESTQISSVPNALVLFNPALILDNVEGEESIPAAKLEELRERIGDDLKKVSPVHHVRTDAPPTIIFHGRADTTVPYRTAEVFAKAMQKSGNRCELVGYDDKAHGFFNFGRDNNTSYRETLAATDRFLVSLGYLPAADSK
jgi:acetyl esterase/lipase